MITNNSLIHAVLTSFMIWGTSVSAEFNLDMSVGVRIDEMKWSIAGDVLGGDPNVLSELTWTDVTSKAVKTELTFVADNGFYFSGMLTFADITDGNLQDSDYMGNNRTVEYSRSSSTTSGDDLLDISAAIGYQNRWNDKTVLTPMIGLSRHEQNFRMTNGVQEINTRSDFTGPFAGLNSTYQAVWQGVWIGLDISHQIGKKLNLFGGMEYHRIYYTAEADWNLRSDFAHPVSFKHTTYDGDGFVFKLGGRYHFSKQFALDLHTTWQFWETDIGIDQIFFSDGRTGYTQFNGAEWNSAAIMIGIRYTLD